MHTKGHRIVAVALAAIAGSIWLAAASTASPGSFTDPDDGSGFNDLKTITHADTASTITYHVDTYGDLNPAGATSGSGELTFRWFLDFAGDQVPEMCVGVQLRPDGTTISRVFGGTNCGTVLADATVTRPAANAVDVSWPRSAIAAAGFGSATGYNYYVETSYCGVGGSCHSDGAPETGTYRHDLTAASTTTTTAAPGATTTSTTAASTTTTTRATTTTITTATSAASCPATSAATVTPNQLAVTQPFSQSGGGCFAPDRELSIMLNSAPVSLGTVRSDSAGRYAFVARVPAGTLPGTHQVTVSGPDRNGGTHQSVGTIVVTGGLLAVTGPRTAGPTAAVGALLILIGALALVIVRRREKAGPA